MKWEVYKKMNSAQRTYWEYNYKHNNLPDAKFTVQTSFQLSFLIIIYAFAIYILFKEGIDITSSLVVFVNLWRVFLWLIYICLFTELVSFFTKSRRENNWLKSEGLI